LAKGFADVCHARGNRQEQVVDKLLKGCSRVSIADSHFHFPGASVLRTSCGHLLGLKKMLTTIRRKQIANDPKRLHQAISRISACEWSSNMLFEHAALLVSPS
jgi:hypothetical protein